MAIEDAVHVTHGDAAAAGLRQIGARNVLVWRDLVTVGRCDLDPVEHRKARAAQWGVPVAPWEDLERALAEAGKKGLVVWSSVTWSDRTYLWCLIDTLERLGVERAKVTLAQPVAEEPWLGLWTIAPGRLRAGLETAAALDDGIADEAIALWRKLAAPSPLGFDEARRAGSSVFPELPVIAEGHAGWSPWRDAEGRLRLSDVDARLLGWIDEEWKSAVDLLRTPESRLPLKEIMAWIGDTNVFARLAAWSAAGAVEVRGDYTRKMPSFEARLTRRGRELLDAGAATVGEMAPLWVGGCLINDARKPWVRSREAGGSRIAEGA